MRISGTTYVHIGIIITANLYIILYYNVSNNLRYYNTLRIAIIIINNSTRPIAVDNYNIVYIDV